MLLARWVKRYQANNLSLLFYYNYLGRLFTIAQALWFTLNCIFRFAQGIFVTTLELTTLSFVLVFLITSYCWYHKPMYANRPITLKLNTTVAAIGKDHHQGPESKWYETPLEYLSRDEGFLARFWRYYIQILHYMHIPLTTRPQRRPYDRIPSHYILNVDTKAEIIATLTILFFSAMYCVEFSFPYQDKEITLAYCQREHYNLCIDWSAPFVVRSENHIPSEVETRKGTS